MEKNFISQILESVGYIAAFAFAISQYILRDNFKAFFGSDERMYSASSLFALIVSIVVIVCIFSNRYSINTKIYYLKKSKDDYMKKIRESANQNGGQVKDFISEPRFFTIKQTALLLTMGSIGLFYLFVSQGNIYVKSISYILLVIFIVSAITIYATGLYLENDWGQQEKNKKDLIMFKIKDYFAGDIKVKLSWRDDSNIVTPFQKMLIERDSKKYNVTVNINDPERFFLVDEVQPGPSQD